MGNFTRIRRELRTRECSASLELIEAVDQFIEAIEDMAPPHHGWGDWIPATITDEAQFLVKRLIDTEQISVQIFDDLCGRLGVDVMQSALDARRKRESTIVPLPEDLGDLDDHPF